MRSHIQRLVADYARLLDESKEYDDYDLPYFEGYSKGRAAGMALALAHLGIEILHPEEDQQHFNINNNMEVQP